MPLNFQELAFFATNFLWVSGTISKCAARFLGAGGFLPLTTYQLPVNNNGIYLFIEGSLISAQALFSLRALFGAMRIHSYTRTASLIRMRQRDLFAKKEK